MIRCDVPGRTPARPFATAMRAVLTVATPMCALLLAACSAGSERTSAPTGGASSFYVNPAGAAVVAHDAAVRDHDPAATRLAALAAQPTATWIADPDPSRAYAAAHEVARGAQAQHRTALLVGYAIPGRDCGSFSRGGAADAATYARWAASVAAGIGDAAAVVVLEPDAVPHTFDACITPDAAARRYAELTTAVRVLQARPHTRVYLDAGNPTWVQDLPELAARLRRSGVAQATGFALNVSSFAATGDVEAYGHRLSALLGGQHFVVDTSRNGAHVPPTTPGGTEWCNPAQARLGQPPTTDTGDPLVDALLWVKPPGESDGSCRPGEPPAGRWWQQYALQLTS